jgi:6-phosphofructokinase
VVLATNLGTAAAHCAGTGEHGVMVALRNNGVVSAPIKDAIAQLRTVARLPSK